MNRKFLYLTKVSLKKKLASKWFIITNFILAVSIILLLNINSIVSFFGGDFNNDIKIIVIDNSKESYDIFKNSITNISLNDKDNILNLDISKTTKSTDNLKKNLKDNEVLIILDKDSEKYLKAKVISNQKIDNITYQIIKEGLTATKTIIGMSENNIDPSILNNITSMVDINREVLTDSNTTDENMDLIMGTIFPTIILPFFMLTIFLIQMVGGEICEEKTTRSMEIIISNISPKKHLLSKILANNIFIIIEGLLLIIYSLIGFLISTNFLSKGLSLPSEITTIFDSLVISGFIDKLIYVIPLTLILIVLSFIAYSTVAGILASMTVNMEDFSQLQTPLVLISLVGYYLAMISGMFNGSILIRILSYVPFLSSFISPSLYMMGEIGIIDIILSIIILIIFIYLVIKFGIKVYKVGILNYSNEKVWTKLIKAFKDKDLN